MPLFLTAAKHPIPSQPRQKGIGAQRSTKRKTHPVLALVPLPQILPFFARARPGAQLI